MHFFCLHFAQDCVQLLQEHIGMLGLEDQSWPESYGQVTTASTIDSYFPQVTKNVVTSVKKNMDIFCKKVEKQD
jgi:hypothetical protein